MSRKECCGRDRRRREKESFDQPVGFSSRRIRLMKYPLGDYRRVSRSCTYRKVRFFRRMELQSFRSGRRFPCRSPAFGGERQLREVNDGATCSRRSGGGVLAEPTQCRSFGDTELPGADSSPQRSGATRQLQQLQVF
ncbi:hypothetical protein QQP08_020125 [Theobroma cacao]|nr:hypothetical protein QQP08_020125 [Theobroma cacao]